MRWSLLLGVIFFIIGLGFSYLAYSLELSLTSRSEIAGTIAAVVYALFSSAFLGYGVALLLHWLFEFAGTLRAFLGQLIAAVAIFFTGVGASIMSGELFLGLHIFFTFSAAGLGLLSLSIIHVFGSIGKGVIAISKYFALRRWIKNL